MSDTEQRLRAVEDAVTRQAADMGEIRGYMRELTQVVVRQEQHDKAMERAFLAIEKLGERVNETESRLDKAEGGATIIRWITGSSLAGFVAMVVAWFTNGNGGS